MSTATLSRKRTRQLGPADHGRELTYDEFVAGKYEEGHYVRNVKLYQRVPSILEYWVFDRCRDPQGPTLTVYHRTSGRQKWKTDDYGPDDVYSTKLLPGFKLPVCPPK